MEWYVQKEVDVLQSLQSSRAGLSSGDAARRLEQYGLNELHKKVGSPLWSLFWSQFASPVVYVLLVACGIALLLGEWVDASVIGFVLFLNTLLGFFQEF